MAGRAAKASAPYLGKSTTAKTILLVFAAISPVFGAYSVPVKLQLLTVKKIEELVP